jgi:hypothetical protein
MEQIWDYVQLPSKKHKTVAVAVRGKDRTTFNQLPEKIRKYYGEHSAEYLEYSHSTECSTWTFWNVWLREEPVQHLPPQAVLQFSPEPQSGKYWIDCREKTPTDWVLTHSNQTTEGMS